MVAQCCTSTVEQLVAGVGEGLGLDLPGQLLNAYQTEEHASCYEVQCSCGGKFATTDFMPYRFTIPHLAAGSSMPALLYDLARSSRMFVPVVICSIPSLCAQLAVN